MGATKLMWPVLSVAVAATVVLLSVLPGDAWLVRVTPMPIQKLLHILFYAALAASLLIGLAAVDVDPRIAVPLIWIGAIGLGLTLEWVQSFLPGRMSRMSDVARDAIGVSTGVVIWLAMRQ